MTLASALRVGTALGERVLAPLDALGRVPALVVTAAALGVLLLGAFRVLTPQRRLRGLRDRMIAALYEMRLFMHQPRLLVRAQVRLVGQNVAYVGLVLPAFLVLAAPVTLLLVRAEVRHGVRPLLPGEEAIVRVALRAPVSGVDAIRVEADAGLEVRPPVVVVASRGEVWVAVRARAPGAWTLTVAAGGRVEGKSVHAGASGAFAAVSPVRVPADDLRAARSSEPPLDAASPVRAMEVDYPARSAWWWPAVFAVSTGVALALRRPLRVTL